MNAAKLLEPRFELIATFPGCRCDVGEVITDLLGSEIKELEAHPHLDRKMNW